jgi:glycosyltransferase 2 family protein
MATQAAASAAVLTWLVRGLDTHALGRLLLTLPAGFYLASLGLVVAGQLLYAWRWWLLLSVSGVNVSLSAAIRYYFIGIFTNNFLPSTVGGDATKVYYLGREHGYRQIAASVLVDRLLGLGSMAVLAAASSWLVPVAEPRFVALRLIVTLVAAGACGVIVVALTGAGGAQRWAAPFGGRVMALALRLQRLRLDMACLLRKPQVFAYSAGVVFSYLSAAALVYVWFVTITGAPAPSVVGVFAALSMIGVLSTVPIALNGLGVREQLHAWLLAPLGIQKEVAVAISLLFFFHVLVISLYGMVLWVMHPAVARDVTVSEAP